MIETIGITAATRIKNAQAIKYEIPTPNEKIFLKIPELLSVNKFLQILWIVKNRGTIVHILPVDLVAVHKHSKNALTTT